jgi:hypothetical protein
MAEPTTLTLEFLETKSMADLPWEKEYEGQDFCELKLPKDDQAFIHIRRVEVNMSNDAGGASEKGKYTINLADSQGRLVDIGAAANGRKLQLVQIKDDAELKQWLEALLAKAEQRTSGPEQQRPGHG